MEWAPVYHVKGWGKFNRHYEDFCTGADISSGKALQFETLSVLFWYFLLADPTAVDSS
jgi:hypothetical protein